MEKRADLMAERDIRKMFAGEWPEGFEQDSSGEHRWIHRRENEARFGPVFDGGVDIRVAAWRYHLISKYGVVPPGYRCDRSGEHGRFRWTDGSFRNDVDSGEDASDQAWAHFTSRVQGPEEMTAYQEELRGRSPEQQAKESSRTLAALVMELAAIEVVMDRLSRQKLVLQQKLVVLSSGQEMIEAMARKAIW